MYIIKWSVCKNYDADNEVNYMKLNNWYISFDEYKEMHRIICINNIHRAKWIDQGL